MEKQHASSAYRVLVNIAIVAAFLGLGYVLVTSDKGDQHQYTERPVSGVPGRTEVQSTEIPSNIPTDMPFMDEGDVIQNFSNEAETGTQSVRRWAVDASPEIILLAYQDYFTANNWNVISTYDSQGIAIIGLGKDDIALSLSVIRELSATQSTIEITANKTSDAN
jgi:hypothetical protein